MRAIAPYVPGKPIAETARELGMPEADILKMASNESPLGPVAESGGGDSQARWTSCTTTPTAAATS